jgi:uncharacterized protein
MRRFRQLVGLLSLLSGFAHAGAYDDLLIATENGRIDAVSSLLTRGMDINTIDIDGSSLLVIAARAGHKPLVEVLLANRAKLNLRNKFGDSAILVAAYHGHVDIIDILIKAGADINPQGWTPLHYAAYAGHLPTIELLISNSAKLDTRAPNGRTALMLAAQNGHQASYASLLRAGANENLIDYEGKNSQTLLRELKFQGNPRPPKPQ